MVNNYSDDIEHIFRAYDIRGVYGVDLFPDIISKASAIFANLLYEKNGGRTIGVSGDGRTTTKILSLAVATGITGAGSNVELISSIPLPIFGFFVWTHKEISGGAYVTASHNPPEWNGVRFRWHDGTGFAEENREIKERFFKGDIKWACWDKVGALSIIDREQVLNRYLEFILSLEPQPEKSLRVIIDTLNGIGGIFIPHIYRNKHDVKTLNSQVDGFFPIGSADPVHSNLEYLQSYITSLKADLGIAFDGDADRAVIIDDKGRRVPPEIIGIILSKELLKSGDVVVYNAECSSILRKHLEEIGIKTVESRVGDVFVSQTAKKYNAKIGVESSYHFFMPLYGFYYDDAILTSYVLASIISSKSKRLSEIVDDIGEFHVIRESIRVPDKLKWDIVEKLKEKLTHEYSDVSTIDGVKVYLEHGSVLIRPSNTEPLIRITSEADTEDRVKMIHKKFKTITEEIVQATKQ